MMRPYVPTRPSAAELSAAKIEEMVERKVSEILAARALDQPEYKVPVDTISEEVQRRLDALEKKIESGEKEDDARSEGLRFLLMAKQHKERGEDSSALKMYELAEPFFPGQQKLQKKIDALRAKIAAKREAVQQEQTGSQKVAAGTMLPPLFRQRQLRGRSKRLGQSQRRDARTPSQMTNTIIQNSRTTIRHTMMTMIASPINPPNPANPNLNNHCPASSLGQQRTAKPPHAPSIFSQSSIREM
jgi:hypothetical protein